MENRRYLLIKFRPEYFDIHSAFTMGVNFMLRMKFKGRIGDRFLFIATGHKGCEYIGEIMSEPVIYRDEDPMEFALGKEKLEHEGVKGCLVRVIEKVDLICHEEIVIRMGVSEDGSVRFRDGSWICKIISREEFNEILGR